jgi:hypothetical protein
MKAGAGGQRWREASVPTEEEIRMKKKAKKDEKKAPKKGK